MGLRHHFRHWLLRQHERRAEREAPADLQRATMVFAPHPDDETLGCGGTILRRRAAGAPVRLVFLTDGRQSHSHLMPAGELVARRRGEALAAGRALAIAAHDVFFLDYPDGALSQHEAQAAGDVAGLLRRFRPEVIFMPYADDPTPDHVATNRIVRSALAAAALRPIVYEYPVWFWHHWPWVSLWPITRGQTRSVLKNTIRMRLGLRLLRDFDQRVGIAAVLDQKRAALAAHASQMTRPLPDKRWNILADIGQGEWLACFFGGHEVFRRYTFDPGAGLSGE